MRGNGEGGRTGRQEEEKKRVKIEERVINESR